MAPNIRNIEIPYSQRAEIRMGFRCNARCGFCYYQELLDNPAENEPSHASILKTLKILRQNGGSEVEFTGGEPTIKPGLKDAIKHAKNLGFTNISLITNGLRLSKLAYAKEIVDAGLNDVLFSLHGFNKQQHDLHTGIDGSFDKIIQAIRNLQALGARVRITTTVTGLNYKDLDKIMAKSIELNAHCIHLAVFSPVTQADGSDPAMRIAYDKAAIQIKKAIDVNKNNLPLLSIKYIPFCFLQGYEQYVMNLYQQSFDPDDWNYYLSNKIRRTTNSASGLLFDLAAVLGFIFAKERRIPLSYGFQGVKIVGFTRLVELIRKTRLKQCKRCKYDLVCDGVWKNYTKLEDTKSIIPILGEKIRHPAWSYTLSQYRTPGVVIDSTVHNTLIPLREIN